MDIDSVYQLYFRDVFLFLQGLTHNEALAEELTQETFFKEQLLELALAIAANGPLALIATKRIINERPDWDSGNMWQKQAEISMPVFASDDSKEGARAFAEKRAPRWTGR